MPDQTSMIEQTDRDIELRRCLYYLMELDKGKSKTDISAELGYKDRRGLYYAIERWDREGILEEARGLYLIPKAEASARAVDRAIDAWPAILDRMVDIALGNTMAKERTEWEVTAWLHEAVIRPALEQQIKAGATEANYAERL